VEKMGAVTLKCPVCGKEITGLTEGHAQRLLRIHKAVKHGLDMTEEERRLVGIVRKYPKEIIEALNDDYTREIIMGILYGELIFFKYQAKEPNFYEILKRANELGMDKDKLITEALVSWFKQNQRN
jgi:hypothetical protein